MKPGAMKPEITPLPPGVAEPLSLMQGACFPDDPWEAAAFECILGLTGVHGYLAWQADSPAGFIVARDIGEEAEILSFGVLPAMRRLGIGRALLDAVAARARAQRLGSIVLEVAADNDPARQLYAAAGFGQVGRRPRYYRRADRVADALILRLGLRQGIAGEATRR